MLNDTKFRAFVANCINDADLAAKWIAYRQTGADTANEVSYFPGAESARYLAYVRGRLRQLALQPNPSDPDLVLLDGYIRTLSDYDLHRTCMELESIRQVVMVTNVTGTIAM